MSAWANLSARLYLPPKESSRGPTLATIRASFGRSNIAPMLPWSSSSIAINRIVSVRTILRSVLRTVSIMRVGRPRVARLIVKGIEDVRCQFSPIARLVGLSHRVAESVIPDVPDLLADVVIDPRFDSGIGA